MPPFFFLLLIRVVCLCHFEKIMLIYKPLPVTEWTSHGSGFLCPELQKEPKGCGTAQPGVLAPQPHSVQ